MLRLINCGNSIKVINVKTNNEKKVYVILGVMSGTSMDGIDMSLIKTNGTNYVRIINEKSYDYSLIILQNKIKN